MKTRLKKLFFITYHLQADISIQRPVSLQGLFSLNQVFQAQ